MTSDGLYESFTEIHWFIQEQKCPCPKSYSKPLRSSSESTILWRNGALATLVKSAAELASLWAQQRCASSAHQKGATKGALVSTLLKAQMTHGSHYGLVDLMDTCIYSCHCMPTRPKVHMKCGIWDRASDWQLLNIFTYKIVDEKQEAKCTQITYYFQRGS